MLGMPESTALHKGYFLEFSAVYGAFLFLPWPCSFCKYKLILVFSAAIELVIEVVRSK